MKALVPFPDLQSPGELELYVYDGASEPPVRAGVELYVLPLTFSTVPLELIAELPDVRVVQTLTAGYEHVTPFLPEHVTLCSGRGIHDVSVAELATALTLSSLVGIPGFVRAQDRGEWNAGPRASLYEKTVVVVGAGSIGTVTCERLRVFGARVVPVARTARDGVHGVDELPELLPAADVVVLTLALTDETRGLVDAAFLARMKDGALLVNVSRGAVVDTDALLAELDAGRLRAALDVTEPEPLPEGHALWAAPGVLITPHVGGPSSAFPIRAKRFLADQLERFVKGDALLNIV
jgi:phosphoglycerate dehydrogenase-like enzyme